MKRQRSGFLNKVKSKLSGTLGVTMAELLIVVAIIAVLGGVAFIAVWNYQRSLAQLERDGIAKEIFVAAQNHLTAAKGEGYLGVSTFGTKGNADGDSEKKVYYYVIDKGSASEDGSDMFDLMLPFGAIDETIRLGGSYIIRYQPETATVVDVFYCSTSGSPKKFNRELLTDEYLTVVGLRDTDTANHKAERRNYTNGSVLGWYGGATASTLPSLALDTPTINVINAEKLYLTVTDPNNGKTGALLQIIIEGISSGAKKSIPLSITSVDSRITYDVINKSYTLILDDITASGMHFAELTADSGSFIPGENIKIHAVAYSTSVLANIASSEEKTTNSLFADNTTTETAYIGNIRHLENLDKTVSSLDANDTTENLVNIRAAVQTSNMSWFEFINTPALASKTIYGSSLVPLTLDSKYYPIQPDYSLSFNGQRHSISDVEVNCNGDAGLFGATSAVTSISNLELIDFDIKGTDSAGALAGILRDCTVTNVLARSSTNASTVNVSASAAGGLIGKTEGNSSVQYSAAAVIVNGSTVAGGLIGEAHGEIIGCYSGGHTKIGSYDEWIKTTSAYDVTGGTVGGLVGSVSGTIRDSYSTCSASGSIASGFAGSAEGSITNCYATGLVDGTTKYAFQASGGTALSGNYYYSQINEVPSTKPNAKDGETEPMLPVSEYTMTATSFEKVKPLDLNVGTFNNFAGAWSDWNPARAYDPELVRYYSGRYTLRTIDELTANLPSGYSNWNELFATTHYGDWPSPEVFFINTNHG